MARAGAGVEDAETPAVSSREVVVSLRTTASESLLSPEMSETSGARRRSRLVANGE
ncbi:hypothetical protein [Haloarchaeobius sp. DFWS5]|uniref:hypothetical protein n=1 Tax=Haloarchaeobius sp. DFWS5 TaxID=3446114 RepID=UPI003EBAE8D8